MGCGGAIVWLGMPRFVSGACFAALLGDRSHGRWLIAPAGDGFTTTRRYRNRSLVLETEFTTADGVVRLVDCMPPRQQAPDLVRVVEGVRGEVRMQMGLIIRFDYGSVVPWVRTIDGVLRAIAGPDALSLWSPVETRGVDLTTRAEFTVRGRTAAFLLVWHRPRVGHADRRRPRRRRRLRGNRGAIAALPREWHQSSSARSYAQGATFAPTGGVVAAPTTSLPEHRRRATGTTLLLAPR